MLIPGGSPSARLQRASLVSRGLTALGIGVAVGMLVLGGLAARSAREDAWHMAEQSSNNLFMALERDIGRNVAVFDLSLQGVIEALGEPGIDQASPGVRRQALFDRAASAEDLGSILIIDAKGIVREGSAGSPPPGLDVSDRDDFAVHRDHPDVGLYVSRVYASPLDHGAQQVSVSRRLPARDGTFAGVVSGALRLSYFQHLFEKIDVGAQGSISLIRTDGRTVWRYPSVSGDTDRDLSASESFTYLSAAHRGQHVGTSIVDGVARLYTFGRVGQLPLILSVNLAVDDIYARWRQKAFIIGPVLLLMCIAIVLLTLLFRREMMRRAAAESALAIAAQDLALMASTDALTGLANRRTFEEHSEREWHRALRDHGELSMLMVDADFFKAFNDRHGHQEGDRILKLVARCIDENVRPATDLAARYGGEEFVVLLPGSDGDSARSIAEQIRSRIEALQIRHPGSVSGVVTVSIGTATACPSSGGEQADLVKAADEALYAAKRDGRNCVRTSAGEPLQPVLSRFIEGRRAMVAT